VGGRAATTILRTWTAADEYADSNAHCAGCGLAAVLQAVHERDAARVEQLLRRMPVGTASRATLHSPPPGGGAGEGSTTALCEAVSARWADGVRLLVRYEVDVDVVDAAGCTPLLLAARLGDPDVVSAQPRPSPARCRTLSVESSRALPHPRPREDSPPCRHFKIQSSASGWRAHLNGSSAYSLLRGVGR
jgi:hypothetical protein